MKRVRVVMDAFKGTEKHDSLGTAGESGCCSQDKN